MSKILLFVFLATTAFAGDKKFEKSFQVSPGGTLTIKTDVGSIRIVGTTANEVKISATVWGRQSDVDGFEFNAAEVSGGIEVTGKLPSRWFRWSSNIGADFVIHVPRNYNVAMETAGGNLEVQDLRGGVSGETSGGNIDVVNVEGKITLGTSGGNVRGEKITGDVRLETSGGHVRITEVLGDVEASTSGGNIKVAEISGKVDVSTSGGHIDVTVKDPYKGVRAETSGGTITVTVPKSISANLDLATSGGEVHCDMPLTVEGRISESRVRGTLNGGGNLIFAHTSGGDVRVRSGK